MNCSRSTPATATLPRPWQRTCFAPLVLSSALISCKEERPRDETQVLDGREPVHEIGQTARASHYEITVLAAKRCKVEPHLRPRRGLKKLGVELVVKGLNSTIVPVNPFYGKLAASGGSRYESTLAGCQPVLEAGRVEAGSALQGWITFDVPEDSDGFEFSYEPIVIGAGVEKTRFRL